MRTPAEAAIYQAERPIYVAADRLQIALNHLTSIRTLIVPRLPIAEAEAALENVEDRIDEMRSILEAALAIHTTEIDRLQADEEVRYTRAHGLSALAERAANDDDATEAA